MYEVKIINLEHRTDRWAEMERQIRAFGIYDYSRSPGVYHDTPYLGFNQAVRNALKGDGDLLLFEDDCLFNGHVFDLHEAIKELPADFDMLYLGANVKSRQERYSQRLFTLTDAWTTHAILYSAKARKWCRENYTEDIQTIYDEWINTVGQEAGLKRFIVKPFLAIQADGYSDIWSANTTYGIKDSEVNLK